MSLDVQQLAHVLANTFNPDAAARSHAEAQLAAFESVPGGHALLLQTLSLPPDSGVPLEVRQAASLRLKNLYQGYWSVREGSDAKISELDRKLVRESILEAIIRTSEPRLRVQLLQVAYFLWPVDKPAEWAGLIPAIIQQLQAGMSASPPDLQRIYGCVATLRMVFKRYFNRPANVRGPIYAITDETFPLLLRITQTLAGLGASGTEQTRDILYQIMKIFFLGSTISLPPSMTNDFSLCTPWFDVLLYLLECPVPGMEIVKSQNPLTAAEELSKTPGWRIKKWASRTFLRIYNRWGRPKHVGLDKKMPPAERAARKNWASQFESQYSTRVMGVLMQLLKSRSEGAFVSDRVMLHALGYLAACVDSAAHYKLLKPHLQFLIQDVILRALCLEQTDLLLWRTDPHEFIRRAYDLMEEFQDPRIAAAGLLYDLLSYRTRDTLQLTLNTLEHVFDAYAKSAPDQRNYLLKDGALNMFGSIHKLLMSKKDFHAGIENILVQHVLPEFASPLGYLRARACWVTGRYYKLHWKNEAAHVQAVQCCVRALQDPELPVQMEAWTAVADIIEKEEVFTYLRDALPTIMQSFHSLFDELGNDAVVQTLERLVDKFHDDVAPYAVQLVGKLVDTYLQLAAQQGGSDDYDDDFDEAGTVQYQLVACIVSVLYAVEKHPEIYAQLLPACCALLDVSIDEKCIEMYENILDILSVLVFQPEFAPIPDCMWKYLPLVVQSWFTWAGDFLNCMMPVFDTFLSKGGDQLCTPQGWPLLESMLRIAQTVLGDKDRLHDGTRACVLVESILANLRGRVDSLLPGIVAMSAQRLIHLVELEAAAKAAREKRRAAALAAAKKKKKAGIKKGKGGAKMVSQQMDEEEEDDEHENREIQALKLALLDNIGIAAHYNPLLFSQIVGGQPPQWQGQLFNVWISHLKSMKHDFDTAKNAVLGLAALMHVPPASLPPMWSDARPVMLGQLLPLLREMSSILAEQGEGDEEGQEGEEDGAHFHDVHEDEDVVHPDDDGDAGSEDVDEAAEEGDSDAPDILLDDMEDALLGLDDNVKFVSPLDDIDPFVFFAETIAGLSAADPAFYQQWVASIGAEGQQLLQAHMKQAEEHRLEIEEEKKKEAEKKAQQ